MSVAITRLPTGIDFSHVDVQLNPSALINGLHDIPNTIALNQINSTVSTGEMSVFTQQKFMHCDSNLNLNAISNGNTLTTPQLRKINLILKKNKNLNKFSIIQNSSNAKSTAS